MRVTRVRGEVSVSEVRLWVAHSMASKMKEGGIEGQLLPREYRWEKFSLENR